MGIKKQDCKSGKKKISTKHFVPNQFVDIHRDKKQASQDITTFQKEPPHY